MGFLDIAQEIKKTGFDARKDSANGTDFEKLPAGEYNVMLQGATFNITKSGWEQLGYTFAVQGGEHDGKTELATFGLMEEWNGQDLKFIVNRTIKFFQKAVVLAGDELLQNDFDDGITLQDALARKAVGSMYLLTIAENTANNGKVYRNYDLDEVPDYSSPLDEALTRLMEISDEDLPF